MVTLSDVVSGPTVRTETRVPTTTPACRVGCSPTVNTETSVISYILAASLMPGEMVCACCYKEIAIVMSCDIANQFSLKVGTCICHAKNHEYRIKIPLQYIKTAIPLKICINITILLHAKHVVYRMAGNFRGF